MLLSQHAIVGSVIAIATGNPVVGFAGGIVSHHILDCLPHVDTNIINLKYKRMDDGELEFVDYSIAVIDVLVTAGIIFWILVSYGSPFLVLIGAFGASLPDLLCHVPLWSKKFRGTKYGKLYRDFHKKWHWKWKGLYWPGIIMAMILQVLITIGGLCFFLKS